MLFINVLLESASDTFCCVSNFEVAKQQVVVSLVIVNPSSQLRLGP